MAGRGTTRGLLPPAGVSQHHSRNELLKAVKSFTNKKNRESRLR